MAKKTAKTKGAKRPTKKAQPTKRGATKRRDELTSEEIDQVAGGVGGSAYYNSLQVKGE